MPGVRRAMARAVYPEPQRLVVANQGARDQGGASGGERGECVGIGLGHGRI
jgi:hypothetical protein